MIPRCSRPHAAARTVSAAAAATAAALLLGSALSVALPADAAAQATSLRAVETVRPSTGERAIELMSPLTATEVAAVERRLVEEGHPPGTVDGRLDVDARRALRAFQRSRELEACGCIDPATVRALGLELRVLVTRVADGGRAATDGDEVSRPRDSGGAVEVLYPTSVDAVAGAGTGAADGGAAGGDPAPAPSAADVEDVTNQEGLSRFGVHRGGVFPVPVPVFLGPATTAPPEGQAGDGRRGAFRLAPFPRVPMPPIRPPRDG